LQGLLGNDTYVVDSAPDVVLDVAGQANDVVQTSAPFALGAAQSIETMETRSPGATIAINRTANELAQLIIGNNGANTLDGGAGGDVLRGLLGNDTYIVDRRSDVVIDTGGAADRILSSATRSLASSSGVEHLTLTGTLAIKGTGNALANT